MFFVYDHTALKREEDDLKDAILYFYPKSTPVDTQCAICGQLMGMMLLFKSLMGSNPKVFKTTKHTFAMKHAGQYTLALSGDCGEHLLINQLDRLYSVFVFYQNSLEKFYKGPLTPILKDQHWTSYLNFIRHYGNKVTAAFQSLPYIELPQKKGELIVLQSTHLLDYCKHHFPVYAGCILYKNGVLSTDLNPDLTFRLLLIGTQLQQNVEILGGGGGAGENFLPHGVHIVPVYLTPDEYRLLSQDTSFTELETKASKSNLESLEALKENTSSSDYGSKPDSSQSDGANNKATKDRISLSGKSVERHKDIGQSDQDGNISCEFLTSDKHPTPTLSNRLSGSFSLSKNTNQIMQNIKNVAAKTTVSGVIGSYQIRVDNSEVSANLNKDIPIFDENTQCDVLDNTLKSGDSNIEESFDDVISRDEAADNCKDGVTKFDTNVGGIAHDSGAEETRNKDISGIAVKENNGSLKEKLIMDGSSSHDIVGVNCTVIEKEKMCQKVLDHKVLVVNSELSIENVSGTYSTDENTGTSSDSNAKSEEDAGTLVNNSNPFGDVETYTAIQRLDENIEVRSHNSDLIEEKQMSNTDTSDLIEEKQMSNTDTSDLIEEKQMSNTDTSDLIEVKQMSNTDTSDLIEVKQMSNTDTSDLIEVKQMSNIENFELIEEKQMSKTDNSDLIDRKVQPQFAGCSDDIEIANESDNIQDESYTRRSNVLQASIPNILKETPDNYRAKQVECVPDIVRETQGKLKELKLYIKPICDDEIQIENSDTNSTQNSDDVLQYIPGVDNLLVIPEETDANPPSVNSSPTDSVLIKENKVKGNVVNSESLALSLDENLPDKLPHQSMNYNKTEKTMTPESVDSSDAFESSWTDFMQYEVERNSPVDLYIQGNSEMLVLLLMKKSSTNVQKMVEELWQNILPQLADLEVKLQMCLKKPQTKTSVETLSYNYLQFDGYKQSLSGKIAISAKNESMSADESQFCETAVNLHNVFSTQQCIKDCTLSNTSFAALAFNRNLPRNSSSVIYGHNMMLQETYFQKVLNRPVSNAPSEKDSTLLIDRRAKDRLLKDQGVSIV